MSNPFAGSFGIIYIVGAFLALWLLVLSVSLARMRKQYTISLERLWRQNEEQNKLLAALMEELGLVVIVNQGPRLVKRK